MSPNRRSGAQQHAVLSVADALASGMHLDVLIPAALAVQYASDGGQGVEGHAYATSKEKKRWQQ
jgi:hypothetical protein